MFSTVRPRSRRRPRLGSTRLRWLVYALFLAAGVAQAAIVPLLPRLATEYGLAPAPTALLLALPGLATLLVSVPAGPAPAPRRPPPGAPAAGVGLVPSCP